jgi:hypothetical protein
MGAVKHKVNPKTKTENAVDGGTVPGAGRYGE